MNADQAPYSLSLCLSHSLSLSLSLCVCVCLSVCRSHWGRYMIWITEECFGRPWAEMEDELWCGHKPSPPLSVPLLLSVRLCLRLCLFLCLFLFLCLCLFLCLFLCLSLTLSDIARSCRSCHAGMSERPLSTPTMRILSRNDPVIPCVHYSQLTTRFDSNTTR